jgi:hypothetical protein
MLSNASHSFMSTCKCESYVTSYVTYVIVLSMKVIWCLNEHNLTRFRLSLCVPASNLNIRKRNERL